MNTEEYLTIMFTPAIPPGKRHQIEDKLEEALASIEADINGGGTELDGSSSDIGIITTQTEKAIRSIRQTLSSLRVAQSTQIEKEKTKEIIPVYGDDFTYKPWWRFW